MSVSLILVTTVSSMIPPWSLVTTLRVPVPSFKLLMSPTTMRSVNATASFPLIEEPSMCETSKILAAERQCLVASIMLSPYWMGMLCPAKGTCRVGMWGVRLGFRAY